jgi:putative intracellular protease/amidase
MGDQLSGKRVAILATDGVERVELEQPRTAVADPGSDVELVSIHDGEIQARNHDLDDAGTFEVDRVITASTRARPSARSATAPERGSRRGGRGPANHELAQRAHRTCAMPARKCSTKRS